MNKKPPMLGGGAKRLIIITLLAMAVMAAILIWAANFELPEAPIDPYELYFDSLPNVDTTFEVTTRPQEPATDPEDLITHIFYWEEGGALELPVRGATGWAATNLVLRAEPSTGAASVASLTPGNGFTIADGSVENWWRVYLPDGTEGWVEIRRSFINCPDVLPSIIYNNTNARASIFRSSDFPLDWVTGERLYEAFSFNPRLGRYEYHVPGMYATARAVFRVQQEALANGETLIIYEVFRPASAQARTRDGLNDLVRTNETVAAAFTGNWHVGQFISQGRSNHQLGAAVDASIAIVLESEVLTVGDFSYVSTTRHLRVGQPSMMHELSPRAVLPNRNRADHYGVGQEIYHMRDYFLREGFRPLSSEWWHFDHTAGINVAASASIAGNFYTPTIYSVPPLRD
jgi:D-alanyl-D-alanine dipeptidase